jgi:hypothetical protein
MPVAKTQVKRPDPVIQFSVFTANRLGKLHQLIGWLSAKQVHVLAITVLDTSDSAIIRLVVDDPDGARAVLQQQGFPFTESNVLVVGMTAATELSALMAALLEAEINIYYLYSFIPHPGGKSLLVLSMEDNEIAEQALQRHEFRVYHQSDISR